MIQHCQSCVLLASPFALLLTLAAPGRAWDDVIDSPMYHDPDIPVPRVLTVFRDAKGLWLRALERPEADLRRQAADAIALAGRRGVKGLDTTVTPLLKALDQEDQHPAVRLAIAKALITLDARDAAPSLLRQTQSGGSDLREIVEPALARWDYRPAAAAWRARLQDPAAPPRSLVLAIQGLAAVGEAQATDRLRELVLSDRAPGTVRLEAARALGSLRGEGLEDDAARLAADPSPRAIVARLAATALLRRHRGDTAVRLLQGLARDREPAVAAAALARLIDLGPELVAAPEQLFANPDANVRSLTVEVLFRRPTGENVRLLSDRLDDVHPEVRVKARRCLCELAARKELRNPAIDAATRALTATAWRGQEQAALLLAQLDHKPAAARLVELLNSDHADVGVAAAWGLRKLAVPETLPRVVSHVEAALERFDRTLGAAAAPGEVARPGRPQGRFEGLGRNPRPAPAEFPEWGIDLRLSQLNQLVGQQKYRPAEAVLQRFIPRRGPSNHLPESRAAAVWALGLIDEGKAIPSLAAALNERLNDIMSGPPLGPEATQVRWMSAVTLGRLRAKEALPSLRKFCPSQVPSEDQFHNVCGWAIEQITGAAMAPPKTIQRELRDWFLTPE